MININGLNIAGLFIFLKEHEDDLDKRMGSLLTKIEKYLFNRLSVQEFEDICELYNDENLELEKKLEELV